MQYIHLQKAASLPLFSRIPRRLLCHDFHPLELSAELVHRSDSIPEGALQISFRDTAVHYYRILLSEDKSTDMQSVLHYDTEINSTDI